MKNLIRRPIKRSILESKRELGQRIGEIGLLKNYSTIFN